MRVEAAAPAPVEEAVLHRGHDLSSAVRNLGKSRCVIDTSTPHGERQLMRLLERADVWLEDSRPGSHGSSPFDPDRIRRDLPHLVITSITPFGQDGPYRDFEATDPTLVALAWVLRSSGEIDAPPVLPPGRFANDITSVVAGFATLAALTQRATTGRGQRLDVAAIDAVAGTTDWSLAAHSGLDGQYPEIRNGSGQGNPLLPCADGWVRLALYSQVEWYRLLAWLDNPIELLDQEFETTPGRAPCWDDLIYPALCKLLADKTIVQAAEEAQSFHIPLTPAVSPAQLLRAEHLRLRHATTTVELPDIGAATVPGGFWTIDGARPTIRPSSVVDPDSIWDGERPFHTTPASDEVEDPEPFSGITVLDFGVAGATPEMSRLLGSYGADVVRIEDGAHPEIFRLMGGASGIGPHMTSSNRSKRSLAVTLADPQGAAVVRDLIGTVDVVLANLAPGALSQLGVDFDALSAEHPSLIALSTQMAGSGGPWSDWRGYGLNVQALSGLTSLWTIPDSTTPAGTAGAFPDHTIGRLGAMVVAANLLARRQHGRGGRIEIAQYEVPFNMLADYVAKESLDPGSTTPPEVHAPRNAPWGVYQCAGEERWCVVTCRSEDDWDRLRAAIGDPQWASDPRFATVAARVEHHHELDRLLGEWTRVRGDRDVMDLLQAAGVPAGYMMYLSDVPTDPQLVHRGYPVLIDQPGFGQFIVEGAGFHAERFEEAERPAPYLGEHTRAVLAERLGLSGGEIQAPDRRGHRLRVGDARLSVAPP